MLFKAKPTLNIPRYINMIKTITSRGYRGSFHKLRRSYGKDASDLRRFLATSGQVTLEVLKNYVESQGKE
ncbi:transposase [Caldisphaera lagunensis]|uniref:transposase n=1 Tax=Caldisphaera lagunensis TaxID=200415 RepID=UPI0026A180F7